MKCDFPFFVAIEKNYKNKQTQNEQKQRNQKQPKNWNIQSFTIPVFLLPRFNENAGKSPGSAADGAIPTQDVVVSTGVNFFLCKKKTVHRQDCLSFGCDFRHLLFPCLVFLFLVKRKSCYRRWPLEFCQRECGSKDESWHRFKNTQLKKKEEKKKRKWTRGSIFPPRRGKKHSNAKQ